MGQKGGEEQVQLGDSSRACGSVETGWSSVCPASDVVRLGMLGRVGGRWAWRDNDERERAKQARRERIIEVQARSAASHS